MSGTPASDLVIRDLRDMEDYRAAFAFQDEVWGPGFTEGVPASLQKVAQWVGGVAAGAFLDGEMVGFVFGITGVRDGELVHWSDILAVRSGVRDGGIGRRLKWHQRQRALDAGARTMQWTWDPLEARNGWLNLQRLGAVAEVYVTEMYGGSTSPLHTGVGTDRLVARWNLVDPRIAAAAEAAAEPAGEASGDHASEAARPAPPAWPTTEPVYAFDLADPDPTGSDHRHGRPQVDVDAPVVTPPEAGREYRVPIPEELQELKRRDPDAAWAWRVATRAALAAALDPGPDGGWRVVGMERTSERGPAYRLLKEGPHGTHANVPSHPRANPAPDAPPTPLR